MLFPVSFLIFIIAVFFSPLSVSPGVSFLFLYCFSIFNFTDFCCHVYCVLPSACFGSSFLSFEEVPEVS